MKYWFYSLVVIGSILFMNSNTTKSNSVASQSMMPQFDATLTKSTIANAPIKYGISVPFTIVITNNGQEIIQNIDIIDYVPSGYTFNTNGSNSIWTASASIQDAYTTTIAGPIDPGLTATVTINLVLNPSIDPNEWINNAEILSYQDNNGQQAESFDINPNDNTDSANVRVYDIALKKELITIPPYFYFDTIVFRSTVYNQGNEVASNIIIQDLVTEGYMFDAAANAPLGWAGGTVKPKYQFLDLAVGDSAFADIKLVLLPTMADAGAWDNYAEVFQLRDANGTVVSTNEADSTPNSNTAAENSVLPGSPDDNNIFSNGPTFNEDEDDHDPAVTRVLDIALKKERNTATASYSYTQNVDFDITVYNQGNVDISQFTIVDTLPCGLDFDPSINPGWSYDASINSVRYTDNTLLPKAATAAGSFRVVTLSLGVNPCYLVDPMIAWDNFTEIESLIAADGLGNEDIDGELDNNFSNDSGGIVNSPSDNSITGNGPRVGEDEDNHDVERVDVYDLALINEIITPEPYSYGQEINFSIKIINQGNIIADSTEIRSHLPSGYSFDAAANSAAGWSAVDANTLTVLYNELIMPADTVEIILKLVVEESSSRLDWVNRAYVFIPRDTNGLNRGDDADSFPFGENIAEESAIPGDTTDNNIFVLGPPDTDMPEDDHDIAGFFVSDMSLTKTISSTPPYTYNQDITFNIEVSNDGGNDITTYSIVDYIPCGYSFSTANNTGWSLNGMSGYLEYTDNTGIIAGDIENVPLVLTLVECANPTLSSWKNIAEISTFVDEDGESFDFDSTPDQDPTNDINNEDDIDSAFIAIDDLSLTKTITSDISNLQFGDPVTFEIAVTNQGNIAQTNILITDYLKCGFGFESSNNPGWATNATTNNLEFLSSAILQPGASLTLTLNVTYESCTGQEVYTNGAEITSSTDPDGNPLTDTDSTPDDTQGNETGGDEDDYDEAGINSFDLSLEKNITSNTTNLSYGDPVTFEIIVSNDGTIDAQDIIIVEYLRCGYTFNAATNPDWDFDANSGYLNYEYTQTLVAGTSVTIPLTLNVQACSSPINPWLNIAEISEANDPNGDPGNDGDSTPDEDPNNDLPNEDDIDSIGVQIDDLSLSKTITSNTTGLNYGDPVTFNIAVTNEGNVTQQNILITDYLPCGYTFSTTGNTGWSLNTITDNLEFTSANSLAPGATLNIPLTVTFVACTGADRYVNGAEITSSTDENDIPLEDTDSTPDGTQGNEVPNEDDYSEASVEAFDLSLQKSISSNTSNISYGDPINFNITISNEGTVDAQNIKIVEYLRCGYAFTTAGNNGWSLDNSTGYLNYTYAPTLAAGDNVVLSLSLTLQECIDPIDPWYNLAEISTAEDPDGNPGDDSDSDPDENPENDPPGEDDNDDTELPIFDLALSKTVVNNQQFEIGDNVEYNIQLTNQGNVAASNIEIVEYLPCGLAFSTNNNNNWSLGVDGYLRYTFTGVLNPTLSTSIPLNLQVQDCGNQIMDYNNKAEISAATDTNGTPRDDVDSTPDDLPNNDPFGEDDIDEVDIDVLIPNGTIGDYIWVDSDGDGVQDGNEQGISGATVNLYDPAGNLVSTTTSGGNGFYEFTSVPVGDYYVEFVPGSDYTATTADGTNDALDSDITGANGANSTNVFTLAGGQELTTIDGGFFQCATICGMVWYDFNENDINDIFENGINNLKVRIYRQVGSSYIFWEETTTGHKPGTGSDDGYFEFCTNPGRYYVEVVMPPLGLVLVRPGIGGPANDSDLNGANGASTTSSFLLSSGGEKCDIKGGFYPMATFGNLVWFDDNLNGIQDNDEVPAPGIPVTLYDEDDLVIESTTTTVEGKYEFEYLQKKEYYIEVTPPSGYNFTAANAGTEDIDSDINHDNGLNTSPRFMMAPGVEAMNIDAGLANGILPVDWTDINATAFHRYNLVEWTVATETNLDRYEVLRWSELESRFISLGVTKPNPAYTYKFEDTDISVNGDYLYKIRQTDYDGRFSESKTVSVNRSNEVESKIYPNPATSFINVQYDRDETYSVEIINHLGQVVMIQNNKTGLNKIDIEGLASGKYTLKIKSQSGDSQHSFIKLN